MNVASLHEQSCHALTASKKYRQTAVMSLETEVKDEQQPKRRASVDEDWLATIVGLALLALALLGWIPSGVLW